MGEDPISNDIVIRKFWKLDFEWNRESFSLLMHLNIKSPLFARWTQKLEEENINDGYIIRVFQHNKASQITYIYKMNHITFH